MKVTDKSFMKYAQDGLLTKIETWESQFPDLKFDKFGRVQIGQIDGVPESALMGMGGTTRTFIDAFNEYLSDKEYRIKNRYGSYEPNFNPNIMDWKTLTTGYVSFSKRVGEEDKFVKIKVSKVFAGVQDIWVRLEPSYKLIMERIKTLRTLGYNYSNSQELRDLGEGKKHIEDGNWYFAYQSLMNEFRDGTKLMFTINPYDLLTSSGGGYGNPTQFGTCWSLRLDEGESSVEFSSDGCFSNPYGIRNLGQILNRGMVYTPNGRKVDLGGTDFAFLGYGERAHVWFDDGTGEVNKGLWYERPYPNRDSSVIDKYEEAFSKLGVNRISVERDSIKFGYNDYEGMEKFVKTKPTVFLDRVGIEEDVMVFMESDRVDYSYGNNISGILGSLRIGDCSCENCGDRVDEDDSYNFDGYYYCSDCYHETFGECAHCNDIEERDNLVIVYGERRRYGREEIYVCQFCADHHYHQCDDCGDYHVVTYNVDGNKNVCESCSENYNFCDGYEEYTSDDTYESTSGNYYSTTYIEEYGYEECPDCNLYSRDSNESKRCNTCEDNYIAGQELKEVS